MILLSLATFTPTCRSFLITWAIILSILNGCSSKQVVSPANSSNQSEALAQRLSAVEAWIEAASQEKENSDTELSQTKIDLKEQLKPIQQQLIALGQKLAVLQETQQHLDQLQNQISTLEERVNFIISKTNSNHKVAPPGWLNKVIWETDGVVYVVGVSDNPSNGKKFALLNAKNELREYFGLQTIDQVQILETFQQGEKYYVLISRTIH